MIAHMHRQGGLTYTSLISFVAGEVPPIVFIR
jgi:hypothetical protein